MFCADNTDMTGRIITTSILFLSFSVSLFAVRVRVLLCDVTPPFTVEVAGGYGVYNPMTKAVIAEGEMARFTVTRRAEGVALGTNGVFPEGVFIAPVRSLSINGVAYKGNMFVKEEEGTLIIVNILDLEEYVKGVLPYEMSSTWPIEALKAQAVAARSYALYHFLLNRQKTLPRLYDVDNTTRYQVYRGTEGVTPEIVKAVRTTEGEVITYCGRVIPAYFHSSCGGTTESAANVFNQDIPYLRGAQCYYSRKHPKEWEYRIEKQELTSLLAKEGVAVGTLSSFSVSKRSAADAALSVRVEGAEGESELTGYRFRMLAGPANVRSPYFSAHVEGDTVIITGTGYGHGVGMSQWGAYGMAEMGFGYHKIVRHYYTGVEVLDYRVLQALLPDTWHQYAHAH